jgi:hypothetical protein
VGLPLNTRIKEVRCLELELKEPTDSGVDLVRRIELTVRPSRE